MDFILEILKAVVYGVIEGITEWLPISSTGHMILAEQVLKFQFSDAFMEMFRVVIQLGAILAVVVLYFRKLWPFCMDNGQTVGFSRHIRWPVMHLWFKIIAACLPAAVLGILLDDWFDAHLYNSLTVATTLILYGVIFIDDGGPARPAPPSSAASPTGRPHVGRWAVFRWCPASPAAARPSSAARCAACPGPARPSSPSSWPFR